MSCDTNTEIMESLFEQVQEEYPDLPIVEMAQTIGRVIRVHKDDRAAVAEGKIPAGAFHLYKKSEGIVSMPIGYKMGNAIAQRLQNVVNQIFLEGVPPLAYC